MSRGTAWLSPITPCLHAPRRRAFGPAIDCTIVAALLLGAFPCREGIAQPAVGTSSTRGSFVGVVGWRTLHWDLSPAQATAALAALGIRATPSPSSGATGIFPVAPRAPGGSSPARGGFVEQTFDRLEVVHLGMRGSLEFAGGQLRAITWVRTVGPTQADVLAIVSDFTRTYGVPTLSQPAQWNQNGVPIAAWRNDRTTLTIMSYAGAASSRNVIVAFERVPRGWP